MGFLNADAIPDLVVASTGCNSVSVLLGHGDGTFGPATSFAAGITPDALATADVNLDGNLDVVAPNSSTAGATVLLGKGDGTLTALATRSSPVAAVSGSRRSRRVISTATASPIWCSPPATSSMADGST